MRVQRSRRITSNRRFSFALFNSYYYDNVHAEPCHPKSTTGYIRYNEAPLGLKRLCNLIFHLLLQL